MQEGKTTREMRCKGSLDWLISALVPPPHLFLTNKNYKTNKEEGGQKQKQHGFIHHFKSQQCKELEAGAANTIKSSIASITNTHSPFQSTALNTSLTYFSRISHFFPVSKDHSVHWPPSLPRKFYFTANDLERSGRRKRVAAVQESPPAVSADTQDSQAISKRGFRILVAGGGIGGLVLALAAKRKGFDVVVFEKDLSAIRGEGQYRGPIQIQSNALAALEAIDAATADEIMAAGCITGDRINGLVDGISGAWYIKFDTFTPAAERGLPVTRVISRMTLQQILARAVGQDTILNDSNVVDFEDDGNKVTVILENGERHEGDLLVGADGIWSKVRVRLFGPKEPLYSGYTCYTGIADFVPADIETVGYRVFLGHKQYFVSSDVGAGKMQWYAFHEEPAGGVDAPNAKKQRLLEIFGDWCDNVIDLIQATDEEEILRRDIYDRLPIFTWGKGRVTLLGDSVHAMQPNLGQGGCMAIEDSYQLALELDKAWRHSVEAGTPMDIPSSLKRYEEERRLRVAVIYSLARMAAIMASTYKSYLGVGLGPLEFLTKLRIPHPGKIGGRFFIDIVMPLMLSWVLGGNRETAKLPTANSQLRRWFEDDDSMERALDAEYGISINESKWYLFPTGNEIPGGALQRIHLSKDEQNPCTIGIEGRRYRVPPNFPVQFHPSDVIEFGSSKAAFRVKVLKSLPETVSEDKNQILQAA
ncbi:hypothetical protein ACLOJK_013751 [Asimina triloba]